MLYPRKIQQTIHPWLKREEIILLSGPRQVGKTSLLKLIANELKKEGVASEEIFYLNLEKFEILNDLNESPENLLRYLKDKKQKGYFLIDEIQYLDNPSHFLKLLFDEYRKQVKLIVTGSSILELKAKLQDSLVGRKVSFRVAPLCFEEFLLFREAKILKYFRKDTLPQEIELQFRKYLEEYLLYGGLPRVVLARLPEEKKTLLENYQNDYINKDVRYFGRIKSILRFNQLVKILARQIGDLLNVNELANTLDLARREVITYLELLEGTFVLERITPFHANLRSRLTKMPKIYWFDLGLRNQILGNFLDLESRDDNGKLFENFVYLELRQRFNQDELSFFRTAHKAEIDFVFEKNNLVYPMEVKYKSLPRPKTSKILQNFCQAKAISCREALLVNLTLNEKKANITCLNYLHFLNLLEKFAK